MDAGTENARGSSLVDLVTTVHRRDLYLASGLWDDSTLVGAVRRWAAERPDQLAVLTETDDGHSYAQLFDHARRAAARLREEGVAPGDVVTVQLPNWYETVVIDLGVHLLGAVLNPVLPMYRAHELGTILRTANSRVIVTPSVYRRFDHAAMVGELRAAHPAVRHLVVDQGDADAEFSRWAPLEDLPEVDPSAVAELIFSSGTEAAPKAIMHTEQTLCAGTRMATEGIGLSDDDSVWMPSPIGHSTGLNYGVRMALYNGLCLTLQDKWDPVEAVALVQRSRPSYTVAATTFLADLLDAADSQGVDLSCLRLFSCGGAPVPSAIVHRAEAAGITVLRLYGSTEILIGTWNRPGSPLEKRLSTEGLPFGPVDIEVRDEEGRAVIGEPGELFVRSPSGCVGFFADPVRTRSTFSVDGWVRSGDIGVIDAEGYFTMSGRRKEIIIRGGQNITPREIEDLIAAMPRVHDVAVVGLPDERLGEIGCACVVAEPGYTVTLHDIVAHLRAEGLAPFKLPERLVLLEGLPRTATGKVQKFELVQQIARSVENSREQERVHG